MAINYSRVNWDTTKYVNPSNMNQMDEGIKDACDGVDNLNIEVDEKIGDMSTLPDPASDLCTNISALNSNLSTINWNLANTCKGLAHQKISSDGNYNYTIPQTGDYLLMARANASALNTSPHIIITTPTSMARNSGVNGSSVMSFDTVTLNKDDVVTFGFSNVTPDPAYNAYFVMLMHT